MVKKIFHNLSDIFNRFLVGKKFRRYKKNMREDNPLKNFPVKMWCNSCEDPYEFFDQYDTFSCWAAKTIKGLSRKSTILDVGGKKLANAFLALSNDVTSLVLMDCQDKMSDVKYVQHDISKKLPFQDNTFDVFTSPGTLHLAGLGRYKDRLDPNVLVNFIAELDRVMKPESDLFLLMPLGKDQLVFNYHYIFELKTVCDMFKMWSLQEYVVDEYVHYFGEANRSGERFSSDIEVSDFRDGEYKIVYLHFKRKRE